MSPTGQLHTPVTDSYCIADQYMIKHPILSSVFCRYLSNYSLLTLMQFIDGKLSAVQLYGCIPYKIEICICEKFVRKINGMASSNKMCHAASARGSVSAAG